MWGLDLHFKGEKIKKILSAVLVKDLLEIFINQVAREITFW